MTVVVNHALRQLREAVLDATETDRAVVAGLSLGAVWHFSSPLMSPAASSASCASGPRWHLRRSASTAYEYPFDERLPTTEGWAKYNRYHWLEGGYPDFLDFFFGQFFPEAHSTKQIEDFVGWGLEIDPATLVTIQDGIIPREREPMRSVCERITAPILVIHGDADVIQHHAAGEALAQITNGQLVIVGGGGHGVLARDPVVVNRVIKRFVERVAR